MVAARFPVLLLRDLGVEELLVLEHLQRAPHRARIVAGAREIGRAELVGLQLLVAPVAGEQRRAERVDRDTAGLRADRRNEDLRDGDGDLRTLRGAQALHRVPRGHVAELVPDDAGELGLGVEVRQDAARDVDVAAGQREGVHVRGVDEHEPVRDAGPVARLGEPLADPLDVCLHAVRVVERVALLDLGVDLAADPQLLRFADEDEVLAAGDRIGGAAREREMERGHERERETARHARDFTAGHSAVRAASARCGAQKKGSRSCPFSCPAPRLRSRSGSLRRSSRPPSRRACTSA